MAARSKTSSRWRRWKPGRLPSYVLAIATIAGIIVNPSGNATPPVHEWNLPLAACVWIRAGEHSGAGLVCDPQRRLALTARHIVGDQKRVEVVFPVLGRPHWPAERLWYLQQRAVLQDSRRWVGARVVRISDELDAALVELEALPTSLPTIRWSLSPPRLGERLVVVGHRSDLPTLWNHSMGVVRAFGRGNEGYFADGRKVGTSADLLLAQLPIEEGDSGGPTFNAQGELVGMVVAARRAAAPAALLVAAAELDRFRRDHPSPTPIRTAAGPTPPAHRLLQATVWVRLPSAERPLAGVLIDPLHVLTVATIPLHPGQAVGIAAPLLLDSGCRHERQLYSDLLTLHQQNAWRPATVVAVDPVRQLVLLRLSSSFSHLRPLAIAERTPRAGESLHTMNHPSGVEFAWVYGQGIVRQCGAVLAADGRTPLRLLLAQLPAIAGCPGGPVVDDHGNLVGLCLEREGPALAVYVLANEELRHFLNVAGVDGSGPRTRQALQATWQRYYQKLLRAVAYGLYARAVFRLRQGQKEKALADLVRALRCDATCRAARHLRLQLLPPDKRTTERDSAIEQGPFDRELLLQRAREACIRRDWRLARGDLQRLLAIHPDDDTARLLLVEVLFELGETALAAEAVRDVLRLQPRRREDLALLLLQQTNRLLEKYPLQPQIASDWLRLALERSGHPPWQQAIRQAAAFEQPQRQLEFLLRVLQPPQLP